MIVPQTYAADRKGGEAHGSLLEAARSIGPEIEGRAPEFESNAMVSQDIVHALDDSGLLRVGTPTDVGGSGGTIIDFIEVTEELARCDGSTGWIEMVAGISPILLNGFMDETGADEVFRRSDGNRGIVAGFSAPVGKGVRVAGGYVISGRWPFASGCDNADWMALGFSVVDKAGNTLPGEGGKPQAVLGAVPADSVEIIRTWDVTGLVGTGSHDLVAKDVFVPDNRTMDAFSLDPIREDPIYYLGKDAVGVAGHAGVALGLMKRALQETATIVRGKVRRGYPSTVDEYPVFQYEFAKAEARYQSARSYLMTAYAEATRQAEQDHFVSPEQRARMRQAATWAHVTVDEVMAPLRVWSASQAFRNPSTLGRVVRDANVLTNHLLLDNITLVNAAPVLLAGYELPA